MSIPAKPKGALSLKTGHPFADGILFRMNIAEQEVLDAPPGIDRLRSEGGYAKAGNITVVNDAYGTGLNKPSGGTDDFILLSRAGFVNPISYEVPFTRVFVVKPHNTDVVLYHSGIRTSGDYNYSSGRQLIRLAGNTVSWLSSNTKAILSGDCTGHMIAGEPNVIGVSWDGTRAAIACNGVVVASVSDATTFTRDVQYDNVGLGSGAQGDTKDGAVFYWFAQYARAFNDTDLASITANPYQMVESISVDTTNPLTNGLVFAGVPKGGRMRDATGRTEVYVQNGEATTNAFGEAVVFGNDKVYKMYPRVNFNGRQANQGPTGMTYMFVGNIAKGGPWSGELFSDYGGAYTLGVDDYGIAYNNDNNHMPLAKADNIDVSGNVVIIWTQGDQSDQDARMYVNGTKVLQKNAVDGWYMHGVQAIGNNPQYAQNNYIVGSGNRAFVWNRKISDAEALSLSANYDAFIVGGSAPPVQVAPQFAVTTNNAGYNIGVGEGPTGAVATINLTMDSPLQNISGLDASTLFTVTGHTVLPKIDQWTDTEFSIYLSDTFVYGENIKLSYIGKPAIVGTNGVAMEDVVDFAIVNEVVALTAVRYIRNRLIGTDLRWTELMAFDVDGNIIPVFNGYTDFLTEAGYERTKGYDQGLGNDNQVRPRASDNVTDGTFTVDLGAVKDVASVTVWHYADGRTYDRSVLEYSLDTITWVTFADTISSTTYAETPDGHEVYAPFVPVPSTPSTPEITNIEPFRNYLSVSYSLADPKMGTIDYYQFRVTPDTGVSYTTMDNPKSLGNLMNGQEYKIEVRAHNEYGFSNYSEPWWGTPTADVDTTPPVPVSAVASNTSYNGKPGIVLTFDETLSASQTPDPTDFTIGGSVANGVFDPVLMDAVNKRLTIASPFSFLPHHTITLSYTRSATVTKRITDAGANEAVSFVDYAVTNGTSPATETVKPTVVSARASNTLRNGTPAIELTFSEKMYESVNPNRFTIPGHTKTGSFLMDNSSGVGVLRLAITEPFTYGEDIRISYAPVDGSQANLYDLQSNLADAFTNLAVTNQVPDGDKPVVVSIVADNTVYNGGPGYILTFSEPVDDAAVFATTDFVVANRAGGDVKGFIKDGANKRLIVGTYTSIIVGTVQSIAYTKPADGTSGIKDVSGNLMDSFTMNSTNPMVAGADTTKPTVASIRVSNTMYNNGPGIEVVMSERTYERFLVFQRFVVSNNAMSGNSLNSIENGVTVYRMGVTNPFMYGQTVNVTYVKSTDGAGFNMRDLYGNEMDEFTNRVATNLVPDNAVPVFMSAKLENGTNPGVIVTFDKDINKDALPAASTFTIAGKTVSAISQYLTDSKSIKVRISDMFSYTDVVKLSYSKPTTNPLKSVGGTEIPSFGPVAVTNPLESPTKPTLPGYLLKTFGTGPEYDFQTENDLNNFVNSFDCITQATKLMIWFYKNVNIGGRQIGPANSDENFYVTWRPAPGLSFLELEAADAPAQYGTVGLEITAPTEGGFRIGTRVEGFRFKISGTSPYQALFMRRNGWDHGGNVGEFVQCRFLLQTASTGIGTGEYGGRANFYDSLFIQDAVTSKEIISNSSGSTIQRCTFVKINGATGPAIFRGSNADDNLFINCGGDPMGDINGQKNITDTPLTTARPAVTYAPAPLITSSTNYRPKAGSAAIGTASFMAVSRNDNKGNNRGLAPDVGAFQLVPAMPLPEGKVTLQKLDGQSLIVQLTTTKLPASGTITLVPSNDPKGAIGVGPVPLVIGDGVASVELDDVPPGNYNAPIIILSNEGGSFPATGSSPFQLMGMSNLAYDTEAPQPATAVTIAAPNTATVNVATENISVGLNGTSSATIKVTPNDNGAGGTFTPASVNIVNGATAFFTYKRPSAGTSQISLTNDAGLVNPLPATIVVSMPAQTVPPTISITTIEQLMFSGRNAKVTGAYDYKGDASGKIEVFFDRVGSTEVLGPFPAIATNGTWTIQQTVAAGTYKVRVVATANGLTTTVTSGNIIMRGLTGRPKLPKQ